MTLNNTTNGRAIRLENDNILVKSFARGLDFSNDFIVNDDGADIGNVSLRLKSRSNPTRSLNSKFIVSSDRDAICTYTFSFTNSTTLAGGTSGRVDCQTSPTGVTFTTQASAGNGMVGGLIIGIAVTGTNIIPATIYVPAGYTVRLNYTGSGGSIIRAMEVLL